MKQKNGQRSNRTDDMQKLLDTLSLRRRMLIRDASYEHYGFRELYPKSTWRPHPNVNILEYIADEPSCPCGWSFKNGVTARIDNGQGGTAGSLSKAIYVMNGIVVVETNVSDHYQFPDGSTQRVYLLKTGFSEYNYGVTGADCFVAKTSITSHYSEGSSQSQILVGPECTGLNFVRAFPEPAGYGGVLDTCQLVFGSYSTRWQNWTNLHKAIIRKEATNIVGNGYCIIGGCTNLEELVFEWDLENDIPSYASSYGIPTTATLYVPLGTTQMYRNKGWNFSQIIEYT